MKITSGISALGFAIGLSVAAVAAQAAQRDQAAGGAQEHTGTPGGCSTCR